MMHFPDHILDGLNFGQSKLLHKSVELILWEARRTHNQKDYWLACQYWFAQKTGISRPWANKCFAVLHKHGLITKVHRRKVKGKYQTCMYKLGPELVKILKGAKAAVQAWVYHVACSLHKEKRTISKRKHIGNEGVLRTPLNINNVGAQEYLNSLIKKYGPKEAS
jgi:DNA-binding HxlR family transcriptional regulator